MLDAQLNVYNFRQMRALPRKRYEFLRFDPNNDCNVHCVYCHNHRDKTAVPTEELQSFLDENVQRLGNFQMGCIMEPTLDKRLGDLLILVGKSKNRPRRRFILQTNGILLHMHDHAKFQEARLNEVSVSIDSADAETHKRLRGGTSIAKVGRNLAEFRKACPEVEVQFITTVTRWNIGAMRELVRFGEDLGVKTFTMREIFYHPQSDVVDHARMPDLLLGPGDFRRFSHEMSAEMDRRVNLIFFGKDDSEQYESLMRTTSFR